MFVWEYCGLTAKQGMIKVNNFSTTGFVFENAHMFNFKVSSVLNIYHLYKSINTRYSQVPSSYLPILLHLANENNQKTIFSRTRLTPGSKKTASPETELKYFFLFFLSVGSQILTKVFFFLFFLFLSLFLATQMLGSGNIIGYLGFVLILFVI